MNPTVGIVVPVFNEASRWNKKYWADFLALPKTSWTFVNDGSSDGTGQLLEELAVEHANVEVRNLPSNVGKAEAVRHGQLNLLSQDSFRWARFMDADGAFRSDDVEALLEACLGLSADTAVGALWSLRIALSGHDTQRSCGATTLDV